jgi:ribosomal protein S18 acetylase RimI-like enzyme
MSEQLAALTTFTLTADIVIRPARNEDLPLLEWYGLFWHFRNVFQDTFLEYQQGHRLMIVAALNDFPVGRVFVQISTGNPVYADGFDRAYLYSLYVIPALQGNGIGTALINYAERELVNRGFTWVTIAVAKDNPGARRLYERLGYTQYHEDSGIWSYVDPDGKGHTINEPCWVLKKRLGND